MRTAKKIHLHEEFAILDAVLDKPSVYLYEIQQVMQSTGTQLATSTICKYLQHSDFSH